MHLNQEWGKVVTFLAEILRIGVGVMLVISGVRAFIRGYARGGAEFEDEREYTGLSAKVVGVMCIALGVAIIFGYLF